MCARYPNLELIEGKSDYLYTVAKDSYLEGKKNPKSKSRDYKILIFDPHGTWPLSKIIKVHASQSDRNKMKCVGFPWNTHPPLPHRLDNY